MNFFDRFWKLRVKDRNGAFEIELQQDDKGNALRVQFEINATIDFRYYTGVIKIFNVQPKIRDQLVFNLLRDEFGTGPLVQLTAGYQDSNGLIFDGAVTRGYTKREPLKGNFISVLEVGLPLAHGKKITIEPLPVTNATLFTFIKSTVDKLLNQSDRIEIGKATQYNLNLKTAIDDYLAAGNVINESIGFSGTTVQIFKEIESRFNVVLFQDNEGFNAVGGKYKTSSSQRSPIILPTGNMIPELTISEKTGMIGSPIYTDTGAKLISYLRSEFRMFQLIKVDSSVVKKNISILNLIHRGDTFTPEWYSEIDGSNFNQLIRDK